MRGRRRASERRTWKPEFVSSSAPSHACSLYQLHRWFNGECVTSWMRQLRTPAAFERSSQVFDIRASLGDVVARRREGLEDISTVAADLIELASGKHVSAKPL